MADLVSLLQNVLLGVVLGFPLLIWLVHSSPTWKRNTKSGARLPDGSLGWPIVGESLIFEEDQISFFSSRIQKYGSVFKTSLFGKPQFVGTTPEFAKFILTQGDIFHNQCPPPCFSNITGPKAFIFRDGPEHLNLKKMFVKGFQAESLKTQVAPLESIIVRTLDSWTEAGSFISKPAAQQLTSEMGLYFLIGVNNANPTPEQLLVRSYMQTLSKAILSVPVNLPITPYGKGIRAKASLKKYLQKFLDQRRGEDKIYNDVLGSYLEALKDPDVSSEVKNLTDDEVTDSLVVVWFGSFETVSHTLVWILKILYENPDTRKIIQAEQEEIRRSKEQSGKSGPLTWEDTRKMVYTAKFLMEANRYNALTPAVWRTASKDMEYKGFLIPKGWAITVCINNNLINPKVFPDPWKFDLNRYEVPPKPYEYIPLGRGTHICPGLEYTRLVGFIFIHHITTTFTYESTAPDTGIHYDCLRAPKGNYPVSFRKRE